MHIKRLKRRSEQGRLGLGKQAPRHLTLYKGQRLSLAPKASPQLLRRS